MSKTAQELGFSVQVEATGDVTPDLVEYAEKKIGAVGRYTSEPILHARVVLAYAGDRAVARRALAQASLDWNGRPIRAHVAMETRREAVDALQQRLRDRLVHGARNWEAQRDRHPTGSGPEWRYGTPVGDRPDWIKREPDDRTLSVHKSFEFVSATPDEAAFDMEMLDHAFVLFREETTDQDSVLYKTDDGFGLVQLQPDPDRLPQTSLALRVSPMPAPTLTVDQAVDRLDMTGLRFVFFKSADSGRGAVIYHRYDGHLGLVTP